VLAELWQHACFVLIGLKHNNTPAVVVLSSTLYCVADAVKHHASSKL